MDEYYEIYKKKPNCFFCRWWRYIEKAEGYCMRHPPLNKESGGVRNRITWGDDYCGCYEPRETELEFYKKWCESWEKSNKSMSKENQEYLKIIKNIGEKFGISKRRPIGKVIELLIKKIDELIGTENEQKK